MGSLNYGAGDGGGSTTSSVPTIQEIHRGGLWTLNKSKIWATFSTYGTEYYKRFQLMGSGSEPNISWYTTGHFMKKGTKIKSYDLLCRTRGVQLNGIELFIAFESTDFDANSMRTATVVRDVVYQGILAYSAGVDSSALNRHRVDLGDFVCPNDGKLVLYLRKPENTNDSDTDRYIYFSDTVYFNGATE